ncbi:type II secretory pathway component [Agaribacter flavus]|uniref:Type II secretory pathway component n=1 Tax=Agaribacter flavus TaxID=1902781 RepID=A0ABV7FRT3_9ALTE
MSQMCPDFQHKVLQTRLFLSSPNKQAGSMTVIALFIMLVLTLLVFTMISVLTSSSATAVQEVYGLRARQAAKVGLQALTSQSFPIGSSTQSCNTSISSPVSFAQINGFRGCSYQARCTSETIVFGGLSYDYFKYSSVGRCDLADSVISRTLSVDAIQERN